MREDEREGTAPGPTRPDESEQAHAVPRTPAKEHGDKYERMVPGTHRSVVQDEIEEHERRGR